MNVESLATLLVKCPYPDSMKHIDRGILGAGFYPGTAGFKDERSPEEGIMLLGRDFGVKSYYKRLCGPPARNETSPTWRRTRDIYLDILDQLPVWCTNYLLGVRKSGPARGNIKDKILASEWPQYKKYCWAFLQAQVLLQRPRIVVVLGKDNRADLCVSDRLGSRTIEPFRFKFRSKGNEHEGIITFADHPHSLIPRIRQDAVRITARQLKALYENRG